MIGEHHTNPLPFTAASALKPFDPVRLSASVARSVVPAATNHVEVHGFIGNASAVVGEGVTVHGQESVVEALAAASLGPGADIGIASTNGALGPVAAASGVARFRVGKSLEAAAAGERFSLYVKPDRLADNT